MSLTFEAGESVLGRYRRTCNSDHNPLLWEAFEEEHLFTDYQQKQMKTQAVTSIFYISKSTTFYISKSKYDLSINMIILIWNIFSKSNMVFQ